MSGEWPFELMEGLVAAFPAGMPPKEIISDIARQSHDGALSIQEALEDQVWTDLDQKTLEAQAKNLIALTPDALLAFIPAFLRAAVKNPESEAATYTFYALAPLGQFDIFFQGTCRLFTPAQAGAIHGVLRFLEKHPSFEPMLEEFGPALEVWKARSEEGLG